MPRADFPSVVTGNRLIDGRIGYYGPMGWETDLRNASIATTSSEQSTLIARASADRSDGEYIEIYALPVQWTDEDDMDNAITALSMREHIRASGGPSMSRPPLKSTDEGD